MQGKDENMNETYLQTIAGEKTSYTPVWFMRQAGRSQAEYRRVKEGRTLFDIVRTPELCAYVTELPVREYDMDAAILYNDIMTPLLYMGVDVTIKSGIGPVIGNPIRSKAEVDALKPLRPEESMPFVGETIELLVKEKLQVPLIGFCGAPFTLASYMIEGGPSKNYTKTRQMLLGEPELWDQFMKKLTDMSIAYTLYQVKSGAKAIQIFDSWIGVVGTEVYYQRIFPYMKRILDAIHSAYPHTPVTMFGVGTIHLLPLWKELPIDVIGIDWRCSWDLVKHMGIEQTVQGNLDPLYLFTDWSILKPEIDRILDLGSRHGRHIFNLGHGILPETNPEVIKKVVAYVHERSGR